MRCLLIICLFVLAGHRVDSAPKTSDGSLDSDCVPGTSWKKDCNHCFCSSNGVAACTLMGCLGSVNSPKLKLPLRKECSPGSSWKSQCNDCVCTSDGIVSCTHELCLRDENEPMRICGPNTTWTDGCYSCRCAADGDTSSCFNNLCPRKP